MLCKNEFTNFRSISGSLDKQKWRALTLDRVDDKHLIEYRTNYSLFNNWMTRENVPVRLLYSGCAFHHYIKGKDNVTRPRINISPKEAIVII